MVAVQIPEDAAQMIAATGVAYVATVRPDGTPNLSPKGTLKMFDETHLAFADIASPRTMKALAHCPTIDINILDPFARRGYRFRGTARISREAALIKWLTEGLSEPYPVRAAVMVEVTEILPLLSPIYTFHGASESEVRARWEARLGYRRVDEEQ